MNKILLTTALVCIAGTAKAQTLEITSNVAIGADCYTTIRALKDPTNGETNPLLGLHPSTGRVLLGCGVAISANEAIPRLIFPHNRRMRNVFWGMVAATEFWMVHHNLRVMGAIRF